MATQAPLSHSVRRPHDPEASISITNFKWDSADHKLKASPAKVPTHTAPLGVLTHFSGNFSGNGISMIFRPNSGPPTGTTFPKPVTPAPPKPPSENVLEINLTTETLNFSTPLGSVPNRGLGRQHDVFLNGVPYTQIVSDVANPLTGKADGAPVGIHFEPGVWMHLPATTTDPVLPSSLVRMGSIPHGTTINAQCLEPTRVLLGPPHIPTVDITPFPIGSPNKKIPFAAQTAIKKDTPRLPQDLTKFIAAGTITQEILTDPNTVLRHANKGKNIIKSEVFTVSTTPPAPEFGGGTANIAFLVGADKDNANAKAVSMTATFWINTIEQHIKVPDLQPGCAPLRLVGPKPYPDARVPTFVVPSSEQHIKARTISVWHTEIQYSQVVNLNFAGLTWPHVSVATLVPTAEQHVVLHTLPSTTDSQSHPVNGHRPIREHVEMKR